MPHTHTHTFLKYGRNMPQSSSYKQFLKDYLLLLHTHIHNPYVFIIIWWLWWMYSDSTDTKVPVYGWQHELKAVSNNNKMKIKSYMRLSKSNVILRKNTTLIPFSSIERTDKNTHIRKLYPSYLLDERSRIPTLTFEQVTWVCYQSETFVQVNRNDACVCVCVSVVLVGFHLSFFHWLKFIASLYS